MKALVSVVEDDCVVRGLLGEWLNRTLEFVCASSHESAEHALVELPRNPPAIVLTDINLPGLSGIELVRRLKPELPNTQFLMLTVYGDTEHILQALQAGAVGYLLKRSTREALLASLRLVLLGGSPMTCGIAQRIVQTIRLPRPGAPGSAGLSPREREILDLLAKGHLQKQIAAELNISQHTVHAYIRNIYEKLQVHSQAQAVAKHMGIT